MFIITYFFAVLIPFAYSNETILQGMNNLLGIRNITSLLANLDLQDSQCYSHIQDFLEGVSGTEKPDWAIQMFDSMEKIPFGILQGRLTYMGAFEECISVKAPEFRGKHCMIDIDVGEENPGLLKPPQKFFYGVCLPSTCNETHINDILQYIQLADDVRLSVNERNCWTDDPVDLSLEDWSAIFIFSLIALLVCASTIYDVVSDKKEDKGKRHRLYSSFSLWSNWKALMTVYDGAGNIGCLHGMRTLTMCWIILAHEYVICMFAPVFNSKDIIWFLRSKENIIMSNGFPSVDTFFFLSGLLVTFVFFRSISKTGGYDVPVSMIHRFLRLTPAYAAMVLLHSTVLSHFGRGPMWNKVVGSGVDMCKEHWWEGLIYLQNILAPTSSCLGQSWYLSSDMQMFWLSPLLLYPLLLWPKIGLVLYVAYLAGALITNFSVAMANDLGPQIVLTTAPRQFEIDYVQTYMRLVPYIIGMGLAYIICGIKANKIRTNLSKTWVCFGWLFSTGICLGSLYGISHFMENENTITVLESASYLSLHRLGWSLGLSWIVFACVTGNGGIINDFLSWNGFQILGKLSYCAFLVHFTIQNCRIGLLRHNYYIRDFDIVMNYFSTLLLSFFLAALLYLFFEAPFSNIDRYFLQDLVIYRYPKKPSRSEEEASSHPESGLDNKAFQNEKFN